MEHRLRRNQSNSDTNASNKTYLKEIQEKRKEETFFSRKNEKIRIKSLGAVARVQPCLLVGDFNVEPTKIPCLAQGISAGRWVDFEEAWALDGWFAACSYL